MGTPNGAKRIEPDVNAYTIGRGTAAEAQLMVTEKMLALVEAAGTVAMGGSAHKIPWARLVAPRSLAEGGC